MNVEIINLYKYLPPSYPVIISWGKETGTGIDTLKEFKTLKEYWYRTNAIMS